MLKKFINLCKSSTSFDSFRQASYKDKFKNKFFITSIMTNFIKKIFDKKIDGDVHAQFQKFSRGEFRNRAEIMAKSSKVKFTINTTAEFSNDLVKDMAEKLGSEKTKVTGAVISTSDLTGKLDFKSKRSEER